MLPIVMPANLNKMAKTLEADYPGRLGLLFSPGAWADPCGLPYALDNGRFVVWSKSKQWDKNAYVDLLNRAKEYSYPPLWVAVPDIVTNGGATIREWSKWAPWIVEHYDFRLAVVVQDGMSPTDVLGLSPVPDVIFVGGTTKWKWRTLPTWCRNFSRVHVGRVNGERGLWTVQQFGAESSDGTGWWHRKQYRKLCHYLKRSAQGHTTEKRSLFS